MATGIGVSMTGWHEQHVVGECQDLLAGFVGIRSEKSIGVTECDKNKECVLTSVLQQRTEGRGEKRILVCLYSYG